MRYFTAGYVQPRCQYAYCDRGADFRDDTGRLACSAHARTFCACGRLMPEALAADGFACATCDLERAMLMEESEG